MCLLCLCPAQCKLFFLSPLPTNCEGSVPCFQIPRLGSGISCYLFTGETAEAHVVSRG